MSYVEEFCENIVILKSGEVVLDGNLKEIKREFGKNRLMVQALSLTPQELAFLMGDAFSDILTVERVQKDRLIIRENREGAKAEILKRLLEYEVDLEYFGLFEPSLNDIFVEKAGDGQ